MLRPVSVRLRALLSAAAIAAALPLAACDQNAADSAMSAYGLPDLPATLPLAVGAPTQAVYAPAGYDLPAAPLLPAARVADPDDYYAYADDAWGYEDSLDYAPPDYGFYYDEVEPWAWQGYDDSLMFVEPLEIGYRTYFYRPGDEYPYFIRDPDCGYGYDDGRLVVIYDSWGGVVPYADYGPRYGYASRYYLRGHDLYWASRHRHPVIAANWIERRPVLTAAYRDWAQDRWQQPAWRSYHERVAGPRERHWQPERARRQADAVRFATWRDQDFRTAAPPRAIPAQWKRARWASDERRYAPPARGFLGDPAERRQAVASERTRVASLASDRHEQARGAAELRRVAMVERHAERRAERPRPAEAREDGRVQRAAFNERPEAARQELRREQAVPRREPGERRAAQIETRREQQPKVQQAAQERRRADAEVRRAETDQRQRAQAEARQARAQRQEAQAAERRQIDARRAVTEQRERAQTEARQARAQRQEAQAAERRQSDARRAGAEQRQQAAREQAQARAAERAQPREQVQQRREQQQEPAQARAERPQREAKPERVARADQSDEERRGRRQR